MAGLSWLAPARREHHGEIEDKCKWRVRAEEAAARAWLACGVGGGAAGTGKFGGDF